MLFSALGDATRLLLVERLGAGRPVPTSELAAGLPITRQAVVKHLGVLAAAGLLHSRRSGRDVVHELDRARMDVASAWLDHVSANWDAALGRLKSFVEEE